nr:MAG TPA: hypothetical protein [Microviridae sp.]
MKKRFSKKRRGKSYRKAATRQPRSAIAQRVGYRM